MVKQGQRIQDLVGLIHKLYAPELAEDWDNVGLQVGDPGRALDRVMVALDPGLEAVEAARDAGAQALVTHHPLLFKPVKRLTPDDAVGKALWAAVRDDVAIISAHTNLDCAVDGLNSWLAQKMGVEQAIPLQAVAGDYLKLVVFVPVGHEDAIADALFSAGGGQIGAYDQCSFRSSGEGTFRPGAGTQPYIGTVGQREKAEEVRLETIIPKRKLLRVLEKMQKAHPYEEVAYDLLPLQNQVPGAGLGRIGRLAQSVSLGEFAARVKESLGCDHLRLIGADQMPVRKVALCGGSGAFLLQTAHRQGADVLVTGDVKYHEARQAEELGIALIDAGHFATEQLMIEQVTQSLQAAARQLNWGVAFEAYTGEEDPFRFY
ncbi:Nif3-like dinuclear metal center hexameric protein [Deltaproteobacteria bacterium IMCC39524]|nr:Nif3-like dinuclear metal center hexameric protein [Deltaproteobacteria bacterium IMCC39524]